MLCLHPQKGATFAFTLSSGNQHLTHLQRDLVSARLHSGTCFGDGLFLAKVQSTRVQEALAREVSQRRRLRHLLQHQGHGQRQSKSFKAELPAETASLQSPPAHSAQCVTISGPSIVTRRQSFRLALRRTPRKPGWRCRAPLAPTRVSFRLDRATLPSSSSSQKRPNGRSVEILQRPEAGQGGFVVPSPELRKLNGLALLL